MHHLYIHAPPHTNKNDIPSWPSLCTLWKTRSKWEICVESAVFVAFVLFRCWFFTKSTTFHVSICVYTCTIYTYMHHQIPSKMIYQLAFFMKDQVKKICVESVVFVVFHVLFSPFHESTIQKCQLFMRRSICVYTCTIYTYMHHQIPPKYKIYLVGLPSVLYERPGQNERSVLNQLFLLLFRCFSWKVPLFIQKVPLFMKTNKTRSICVYTCTIYTYMHHIHHQIPPKYKIYLVGLPSVLYETPGQNERSVLNQLFLLLFMCFS